MALPTGSCREILSAITALVPTLTPNSPIFATFHDGQAHDPLGGGSYAFQEDAIGPVLSALMNDEVLSNGENNSHGDGRKSGEPGFKDRLVTDHESGVPPAVPFPTRSIVIHAKAQPNTSPSCQHTRPLLLCFLGRSRDLRPHASYGG